jgi:hypothetical protein
MTDEEKQERLENVVKLISKTKQLKRKRNILNLSQRTHEKKCAQKGRNMQACSWNKGSLD